MQCRSLLLLVGAVRKDQVDKHQPAASALNNQEGLRLVIFFVLTHPSFKPEVPLKSRFKVLLHCLVQKKASRFADLSCFVEF